MTYSYKIVLDSFFEAREAYWNEEALTDDPISSPKYGKAPSPWNLYSAIDPVFKDHENRIRVPFTDVMKRGQKGKYNILGNVCKSIK